MKFSELIDVLSDEIVSSISFSSDFELIFTDLAFDSRQVKAGSIFFSIPGVKEDGAKYINDAIIRGASLIVASTTYSDPCSVPILKVKDVRKALAILAKLFYQDPSSKLRMIGVTGTNGKTSTTWILSKVLSHISGPTIYLGTLGTVIMREGKEERLSPEVQTTRDIIFNCEMLSKALNDGCINAVLEVTSHGLDQFRTYGFEWDVCGFTNLTQDHLDYHSDMSEYADAKRKLFFEELESSKKPSKVAVVNADNITGQEILSSLSLNKNIGRLSFSAEHKEESLFQKQVTIGEFDSMLSLDFQDSNFLLTTPLLGAFNYENLRCAVGILLGLGYSPKDISDAGKYVESVPGRIELVSKSLPRVFVDYAHTPDALDKIQDVLREMLTEEERLITVFGCGGDRDSKKRPLMGRSVAERSDVVIVTSDNPRTEDPERIIDEIIKGIVNIDIVREVDRKSAIEKAINLADRHDIVLIAGKGHEDYQIIGHEKKFFCDRTFAKEFIDKRGL